MQRDNSRVYKLKTEATWSLNDLKLVHTRGSSSEIISEEALKRLSELAAIDLDYTKISRDDIMNDINFILNCATVLGNCIATNSYNIETDSSYTSNIGFMQYKDLRVDEFVSPPNESEHRTKLMKNATKNYNNYFVVPKK